jgi:hypothetical protein
MPATDELSEKQFEARFQSGFNVRYLADDGFTERTLQRLPGRRRSLRRWVLGTAALLAVLIAGLLTPDLVALAGQVGRALRGAAAAVSGAWSITALVIAIALVSVLALLREEA